MTFQPPADGIAASLVDRMFEASLPAGTCAACHDPLRRRQPRVQIRPSWRDQTDSLCVDCWSVICQWASRFALEQLQLPL